MKSFLPLRTLALLGLVACSGAESREHSGAAGGTFNEAEIPDSAGLALDSSCRSASARSAT